VIFDEHIIASLLETSTPEASEFISSKLLVTVFLTVVLGFTITLPYLRYYRPTFLGTSLRASLAALILSVVGFTVPNPLEASADVFIPAAFGFRVYKYYLKRQEKDEQVQNRFDIAILPSSIDPKTSDNSTLVLVIGESARADHLSLNGYYRETNAYTEKETGLINFKDVISCDTFTRISVPCLLTRATLQNKSLITRETSLLNLARKHDFHITWISNNDIYGQNNLPTSVIANSADEKIFRFGLDVNYDEASDLYLLPYFHRIVDKHKGGRQLIVVHLRGSHSRYSRRYPRSFAIFKPDDDSSTANLINSYDNSILFTDYILSQLIEDLRDREALLFYVSDHGESLGEIDERGQAHWEHGENQRIEQRIVPMQVWASDLFIARYPDRFAALRRRVTTRLSHDHFFHSVLDCVGIHSDAVDKRLSLCTQGNFTEREGAFPVDNSGHDDPVSVTNPASAIRFFGLVLAGFMLPVGALWLVEGVIRKHRLKSLLRRKHASAVS
jgi:glucan phosphoethanolaminetransferase (alkaline phosphatase superfamily)